MYSPAELSWHFEIISLAANPDQINNTAMATNADNVMPPMILKVRITASPRRKKPYDFAPCAASPSYPSLTGNAARRSFSLKTGCFLCALTSEDGGFDPTVVRITG
jgi:hypothetical protein